MRRPSLRAQLNQIRLWVRQGRTDAWIAHKLDISVEQLEQFKRDHGLDGDASPPAPVPSVSEPPRPEPAVLDDEDDLEALEHPAARERMDEREDEGEREREGERPESDEGPRRRRRRGRRGGRGRTARPETSFEGTFDHGDEGYGLWLDPAVAETRVYADNWAGHRAVTVTVEADRITIRRSDADGDAARDDADD